MIAVFKDCFLGRVVEVYPWYSKVLLITDPGCKVAVYAPKPERRQSMKGPSSSMLLN